jgi:hypothetical protein
MEEIAQQTWKQGRIKRERFFFDSASVVQASEAHKVA